MSCCSVYGHENTSAAWTMVKLNFSQILSEKCEASDYTSWMVSDHDSVSVDLNGWCKTPDTSGEQVDH